MLLSFTCHARLYHSGRLACAYGTARSKDIPISIINNPGAFLPSNTMPAAFLKTAGKNNSGTIPYYNGRILIFL
jgi:hypothetical protein